MKLQLNEFPEIETLEGLMKKDNVDWKNPAEIEDLITNKADHPTDSTFSEGWKRAGGESFMREVYIQNEDNPDFIQKSGNSRKTIERGGHLSYTGANVIPTLIVVTPEGLESEGKISGSEHLIFQKYVQGPELESVYEDPSSFGDQYNNDNLGDKAVRQFGENAAVIDNLGFGIKDSERMIYEMLTDGENCCIADFGADLGGSGYEPHSKMYEEGIEFLDEEDIGIFEQAYTEAKNDSETGKHNFSTEKLKV